MSRRESWFRRVIAARRDQALPTLDLAARLIRWARQALGLRFLQQVADWAVGCFRALGWPRSRCFARRDRERGGLVSALYLA